MVNISGGINETDEKLFQFVYQKALEKETDLVSSNDVSEIIKSLAISKEELFESVDILRKYGLINPIITYNRTIVDIGITAGGFEAYARNYREDYYSLFDIVPSKIVNEKLWSSKDISGNLQKPLLVVNLILDYFIQGGFIKADQTLDMNIHILELDSQFTRTFRKK